MFQVADLVVVADGLIKAGHTSPERLSEAAAVGLSRMPVSAESGILRAGRCRLAARNSAPFAPCACGPS
jgi:hypothetical protein